MGAAENICAVDYARTRFGVLADDREVEAITLANSHGLSVRILTLGATVQSLLVPDRSGRVADVVLGYDNAEAYLHNPDYFGATIGRYANRIAKGRFELQGRSHQLALNNGANALHGGVVGLGKSLWHVGHMTRGASASVELLHDSPDGADGYPGALAVAVVYELDDAGDLAIRYRATTDQPTIVNLTNHSYFNLSGEDSPLGIEDHVLTLPANSYLPVDATLIPTGEIRHVSGTPFDFRSGKPIGAEIGADDVQLQLGRGYDHNWVLDDWLPEEGLPDRAPSAPRFVARLADPKSGRTLELLASKPGLQFYSGNFLNGTQTGKSGRAYACRHGLALEPQLFPDTPNQPAFGSAQLLPGEVYEHQIVFRLRAGP
jgi:aldose 1-epimerase